MSGLDMRGRNRVAIDWEHSDTLLGYANHFEQTAEGLEVSGALIPFEDNDQASRLIYMAANGVPLEASITWGGDNTQIEEVAEGETAQVNGYDFSGPGVVVRRWELRSIAICKSGYDQRTVTELSDGEQLTIEIIGGNTMSAEAPAVEATEPETPDTEAPAVEVSQPEADVEATEQSGEALAVEPTSEIKALGQKYLDAFGDDGALMFAKGYSFDEATQMYLRYQRGQIEALTAQITTQKKERGLSQPVQFAAAKDSSNGPQSLAETIRIKK